MPFPVAHTLAAWSLGSLWRGRALRLSDWAMAAWWSLLSLAPDFDFAAVWLTGNPDLHRSATHALLTALLTGFILAAVETRRWDWHKGGLYTGLIGSHGLLDWATTLDPNNGPALFWPFIERGYALGRWTRPKIDILSSDTWNKDLTVMLEVLLGELVLTLPVFLLITLVLAYGRPQPVSETP